MEIAVIGEVILDMIGIDVCYIRAGGAVVVNVALHCWGAGGGRSKNGFRNASCQNYRNVI